MVSSRLLLRLWLWLWLWANFPVTHRHRTLALKRRNNCLTQETKEEDPNQEASPPKPNWIERIYKYMASSPCAACKFLRRKCVFAHKFANVHKVLGASNVTKLLNELHPHQREDAVNSLAYEADMRLRDPVYGCVGVISLLQHQLQLDKSELHKYHQTLIAPAAYHAATIGHLTHYRPAAGDTIDPS